MEICHFKNYFLKSLLIIYFCAFGSLIAQSEFYACNSKFDDSASEWYIYTIDKDGNEVESQIRLKWPFKNDWTEWSAIHHDDFYNVKLKYKNIPDHWEMRTPHGSIISMKTKWSNDFTEWVITENDLKLKWISEYRNNMSSWYFEHKTLGFMNMYTYNAGDPRDWILEDEAIDVSDEMKLAMVFISVYLTNPKR